nr:hypothetical protein [Tanacetum cinerariifolium]
SSSDKETILDKEDAFKQGRIDKIDADKDISLVSTHEDVSIYDDVSIQDEGIEIVVEEEVVEAITTAKMIFEVAIVSTSVSAAATTITTAPTTDATKISVVINTSPRVRWITI